MGASFPLLARSGRALFLPEVRPGLTAKEKLRYSPDMLTHSQTLFLFPAALSLALLGLLLRPARS